MFNRAEGLAEAERPHEVCRVTYQNDPAWEDAGGDELLRNIKLFANPFNTRKLLKARKEHHVALSVVGKPTVSEQRLLSEPKARSEKLDQKETETHIPLQPIVKANPEFCEFLKANLADLLSTARKGAFGQDAAFSAGLGGHRFVASAVGRVRRRPASKMAPSKISEDRKTFRHRTNW